MSNAPKPKMQHATRNDALDRITVLITSALGFVAALAWNSAVQKLFSVIFGTQSSLAAMFTYAVVVTIIAVVVIIYLSRSLGRLKG